MNNRNVLLNLLDEEKEKKYYIHMENARAYSSQCHWNITGTKMLPKIQNWATETKKKKKTPSNSGNLRNLKQFKL